MIETLQAIDKAHTEQDLKSISANLNQVKRLLSVHCTTSFELEEVFFSTKTHLIVLRFLDFKFNLGDENIIRQALECISNLLLSSKEALDLMLKLGFLPILYNYLDISKLNNLKCIYWGLANMLGESLCYRPAMIKNGFIDFILENFEVLKTNNSVSCVISWFLSNIMKTDINIKDSSNIDLNVDIAKAVLKKTIIFFDKNTPEEAFSETVWAVSFFLNNRQDVLSNLNFLDSINIQSKINRSIDRIQIKEVKAMVRILGKLSFGSSSIIERLDLEKVKNFLLNVVNTLKESQTQSDALWTISNLILTNAQISNFFYSRNLLKDLCDKIMSKKENFRVQTEILMIISGFFKMQSLTDKEKMVFEMKIIDVALFALEVDSLDVVKSSLSLIEKVLEYGETLFSSK